MSIENIKIRDSDFTNKDIRSLPDRPSEAGIDAATLKDRFDYGAKHIIAPKINQLIDAALSGEMTGEMIIHVEGLVNTTVQGVVAELLQLQNLHKADMNNPHQTTKAQVGMGNADNTSDMDKPISTAQQQAINGLSDRIDGLGTSLQTTRQELSQVRQSALDANNKADNLAIRTGQLEKKTVTMEQSLSQVRDSAALANNKSDILKVRIDSLDISLQSLNQQLPQIKQETAEISRKATEAFQIAWRAENTANGIAWTANEALRIAQGAQRIVMENLYGYDPVTGQYMGLYDIIINVYNATSEYALTASEYYRYKLRAMEYDSLNITAMEYDRKLEKILRDKKVITASEYDALQLTAASYEAYQPTALEYSRQGGHILKGA